MCDVAICNSYIIMCESPHYVLKSHMNHVRPRTQLEYKMALSHFLLNDFNMKIKLMQPPSMDKQKLKKTNQKTKKSGMDEDRARYIDIEQMVKRELRDTERVYVNGILQNGLESGNNK